MKIRTIVSLIATGQIGLLRSLERALPPVYRVCFVAAAASNGVLRLLANGPQTLESLARSLGVDTAHFDSLEAWLRIGTGLGELQLGRDGYALHGAMSRAMAPARADAAAAMLEEAATLHMKLILETLSYARAGRRFALTDQRGDLTARSSRLLEPFVGEAVDRVVPAHGPLRLLEIGCGSGVHIRRAAQRNPALRALGLELQSEVAEIARANVRAWGIDNRVVIEHDDVRERTPDPAFDIATLHNNLYYFPVASRTALLTHVRGFLKPSGRILLTTACLGGGLAMEALNLWAATTEGCGRLPTVAELHADLRAAGFVDVRVDRLVPGESYFAASATAPG